MEQQTEYTYVLVECSLDGEIGSVFGPYGSREDAKAGVKSLDEEFFRMYPATHAGFVIREMERVRE